VNDTAHGLAMVAAAREDLKRLRVAAEALAVTFDRLLAPAGPTDPVEPVQAPAGRPAVGVAMALLGYLQAGGQLPADLAADLAQELAAARLRSRSPHPG
jgi:hypothetical protein